MEKPKYTIKVHKVPIYDSKIIYCEYYPEHYYELLKKLERLYGFNDPEMKGLEHSFGIYSDGEQKDGTFYLFINLDQNTSKEIYMDTFTHEMRHIIDNFMIHYDLIHDRKDNNEHLMYLTGFLHSTVINYKKLR